MRGMPSEDPLKLIFELWPTDRVQCAPVADVAAHLGELQRLRNRLDAYEANLLTTVGETKLASSVGERDPAVALTKLQRISRAEARSRRRVAQAKLANPECGRALDDGTITGRQLTDLVEAQVSSEQRSQLLSAATSQSTDQTRRSVRQAEREHRKEDAEQRQQRLRGKRTARRWTDDDGMRRFEFTLDPDAAAPVDACLTQLTDRLFRQDKRTRATGARREDQRLADALVELACHHVSPGSSPASAGDHNDGSPAPATDPGPKAGVTERGRMASTDRRRASPTGPASRPDRAARADRAAPPPVINVTVGHQWLTDTCAQVVGRTDHGTEVSPGLLRQMACDAELLPTVLGGHSEVLDVGRSRRVVPPTLRRALVARDGGCVAPGCDAPAAFCHAHHVRHWIDGGPTSLDNLVLLCHSHHQHVHAAGLTPRRSTTTQQSDPGVQWELTQTHPGADRTSVGS